MSYGSTSTRVILCRDIANPRMARINSSGSSVPSTNTATADHYSLYQPHFPHRNPSVIPHACVPLCLTGSVALPRSCPPSIALNCTSSPSCSRSRAIGIVSLVHGRSWWNIWVATYGSNDARLVKDSVGRWCIEGNHANGLGALCGGSLWMGSNTRGLSPYSQLSWSVT